MQKRSKRLCLALAVLLSVSMVLVALVPAVEAASYKKGSGGAIYYFNPSTATSSWIWSRPLITVIGKHRFCS